jgi:hypothetical protein
MTKPIATRGVFAPSPSRDSKAHTTTSVARSILEHGRALEADPHLAPIEEVLGIVPEVNRDPVDAAIDHSSGWVEVVEDRTGRRVAAQRAQEDLDEALRNGESDVDLRVRKTEPEVTADEFDKVLLLRIGENKLYLYQDGEISHSWTVATGQPGHSTPTGMFEVGTKRYMPTWHNPAPNGWGADMPRRSLWGISHPGWFGSL